MARPLNLKQLAFVKLYLGGDATVIGNATACYREAYKSPSSAKVIHAMASKLLRQPKIRATIDRATTKAIQAVDWSAQSVLEESIKLYDRCMGYDYYPVEYTTRDKEGVRTVHTEQRKSFNSAGARAALELIGRNTAIQAFQDNIEVSHTHYLEQALARRAKVIEDRADRTLPVLPGTVDQVSVPLPAPGDMHPGHAPGPDRRPPGDDDTPGTAARPDPTRNTPGGSDKEGPSTGGQAECDAR